MFHNPTQVVLIVILFLLVGFFFLNNVVHVGIHIGHTHEEMANTDHSDELAYYEIAPSTVADKITEGEDFILLDVRTPEEYEEVHVHGAILLPLQELSQKTLTAAGLGGAAKDTEIIIYCGSGNRSTQAYDKMSVLGYTNVKSMAGGLSCWQEDDYPFLEHGPYEDASGNAAPAQDTGAHITFDRTFYDFGTIAQFGGIVQTTFTVSNTGRETLEIGTLSTSCGCTSAEISSHSIAPGEMATLTVFFDPDFHEEPPGVITRTVFIPTNDPDQPEAEVRITVDILEGE